MATTLAVRFPLGRYHANPWDRSVNEGTVEWPPSPWRILRALLATWHTRWPDLPAATIDGLISALAEPPSYRTPATWPGHTRHYLPGLDHKKGEIGGTDLTLDPFQSIERGCELLIRWNMDLGSEQRAVLAKLAELLPYLGRAESACEARLLNENPEPDGHWWLPGAKGTKTVRLLAPAQPVSRAALEITTVEVRRQRRTLPPGTLWVSYAIADPPQHRGSPRRDTAGVEVEAVRFALDGFVPLRSTHAVLLADEAHRVFGGLLREAGIPDDRRQQVLGTGRAGSGHRHAHWVPVAVHQERGAPVRSLVLWVPQGLRPREVAAVIDPGCLSGQRGTPENGYRVRGFPKVRLLFQAAGTIGQVAPEFCGLARHWRSLTPYLPVRHRKQRQPFGDFLAEDIHAELGYREQFRGIPVPVVAPVDPEGGMPDRWALEFRRYRMAENMGKSRPGLGLRLRFPQEISGPLLLGQLSHFGYGIFTPEQG
jgi:CRISPR-associated protein Csb2